jgi:hypothetical protein
MIVPSQLALKTNTNFGCAVSLATLDRFPLPLVAPPIGHTSFTHVMNLAAHSTTGRVCKAKIARNYKPHRRRPTRRPPKRWKDS